MLSNPYREGTLAHQLFQEGADAARKDFAEGLDMDGPPDPPPDDDDPIIILKGR